MDYSPMSKVEVSDHPCDPKIQKLKGKREHALGKRLRVNSRTKDVLRDKD